MIAGLEAYKAGLYTRQNLVRNLIAGCIVGVVALPLSMAFAIASGAKPEQGLYTAIVAGIVAAIFGGSRAQVSGPTGAFIVILAGITAQYGIAGLQLATLMAGIILLLMGFAGMGTLIKFIPAPVIAGFTAGIGVIIFVGQWVDFFGLQGVVGTHFHQKFASLLTHLSQLHWPTLMIGVLSLLLILGAPKINFLRQVPGPLLALIGGTLTMALWQPEGVRTIGSVFGALPQTLPTFTLPSVSVSKVIELIGPAFTIALLCAIESLLSAVVADGMAGTRHQSNQELIGQGLANILSPLLGGFAATGALARTATNIRHGGNSPVAGVVQSLVLLLIIMVLAPWAVHIPMATLSAILFVVAWNMSDVPHCVQLIQRAPRADSVLLLVTFFLTVFTDVVVAVNIGVILATLYFLRRMAQSGEVRRPHHNEIADELDKLGWATLPHDTVVYALDGPMFFGTVDKLESALASTAETPKTLILHFRWVPYIDFTAQKALEDAIKSFERRGVKVLLSGVNPTMLARLHKANIIQGVGEQHCFMALAEALLFAQKSPTPTPPIN